MTTEGQDQILLLLEATAMGYFQYREALVIEQVSCLQHTPFQHHLIQGDSGEQLESNAQIATIDIKEQCDVRCILSLRLADSIHHLVNDHLTSGFVRVIQLFYSFDYMFHILLIEVLGLHILP